jgi:hypothetical protein
MGVPPWAALFPRTQPLQLGMHPPATASHARFHTLCQAFAVRMRWAKPLCQRPSQD